MQKMPKKHFLNKNIKELDAGQVIAYKKAVLGVRGFIKGVKGVLSQNTLYLLKEMGFAIEQNIKLQPFSDFYSGIIAMV